MPFKKGMIMLWSGSLATIPKGWLLCDGMNGTPFLIDNFIIAAGSGYQPGDSGGIIGHQHEITGPPHSHSMVAGTGVDAGNDFNPTTDSHSPNLGTSLEDNRPPWYALAYIMKT